MTETSDEPKAGAGSMEPAMGRAIRAIQTRDLPTLFSFFGLQTKEEVLESRREEISARFAVEVAEILRLCTRIRERERYQLFREALRVSYQSALRRQVSATP